MTLIVFHIGEGDKIADTLGSDRFVSNSESEDGAKVKFKMCHEVLEMARFVYAALPFRMSAVLDPLIAASCSADDAMETLVY